MPCPLSASGAHTVSKLSITINLANFLGHTIPQGPHFGGQHWNKTPCCFYSLLITQGQASSADFGRQAPSGPGCPPPNNAHMFRRIPSLPNPGREEKGFSSCRQRGSSMLRYHFVSQVMSRDFCLGLAACSLEMKDTVLDSPRDKCPPLQP